MKKLLLFTYCLLSINCFSQIIDNSSCNAFSEDPFFNSDIIKMNKIKAFHGSISTKKELSVVKKSNLVICYVFDEEGKLIKQYNSFKRSKKVDTTFIQYLYSDSGNLITKRTNDAYGFFSYNYKFDDSNRIIKKTYCREDNAGSNRNNFKLGKQYVIIDETYSYKIADTIINKTVYNNNDRAYQIQEYIYDKLGYLKEERKKLIINNKRSLIKYKYDDHGLLRSKTTYKNIDEYLFDNILYQYDIHGNLTYIDEYKNKKHITHKEILYDPSTMLLKTLIIQDVEINFIKIIKFKPEFFK